LKNIGDDMSEEIGNIIDMDIKDGAIVGDADIGGQETKFRVHIGKRNTKILITIIGIIVVVSKILGYW